MGFRGVNGFVEFVVEGFVRCFDWREMRFVFRGAGGGSGGRTIGFGDFRASFDESIKCRRGARAGGFLRGGGSKSSPLHEGFGEEEVLIRAKRVVEHGPVRICARIMSFLGSSCTCHSSGRIPDGSRRRSYTLFFRLLSSTSSTIRSVTPFHSCTSSRASRDGRRNGWRSAMPTPPGLFRSISGTGT